MNAKNTTIASINPNQSHFRLVWFIIIVVILLISVVLVINGDDEDAMSEDIWRALDDFRADTAASGQQPPKCQDSDGPVLTKAEWERLNDLYQRIPPPAQSKLWNYGDHYTVYRILTRELGFKDTPTDAITMWRFLEDLLCGGYHD